MEKFDEMLKKIKKIVKYRSDKDSEIFLPYKTTSEQIHEIMVLCREGFSSWHIIFTEPTEEILEPEIKMYWEEKS